MPYNDPEKRKEYVKAWHKSNLEKRKEYDKAWRLANSEKKKEADKAWRLANSEEHNESIKNWRNNNTEWMDLYNQLYYQFSKRADWKEILKREKLAFKLEQEKFLRKD